MSRLGPLLRHHAFDLLVVVAALGGALDVVLSDDATLPAWVAAPAAALLVLPLLGRRRSPFEAPAAVWLLAAALSFADGPLVGSTAAVAAAGYAAALLLGQLPDAVQARIGLAIVVSGAAIIVSNGSDHAPGDFVFTPALFATAWVAGYALRRRGEEADAAAVRAAHAERERDAAARIAVAEERARIARELHDIVAHAVSVIVLQVGAVRHNLPESQAEDRDALRSAEQAGRTALADMRRLVGAMRRDGEDLDLAPQPGLDDLDALLEEVRRAGLPVRLRVEGDPFPLPRTLDLSAYRIVQEGLTNTLKHARATSADVVVRYGSGELGVDVRDDGRGDAPGDGLGHGLVGVGERVKIYGGAMTAGAAPGGGFLLSTRLPLDGERP